MEATSESILTGKWKLCRRQLERRLLLEGLGAVRWCDSTRQPSPCQWLLAVGEGAMEDRDAGSGRVVGACCPGEPGCSLGHGEQSQIFSRDA